MPGGTRIALAAAFSAALALASPRADAQGTCTPGHAVRLDQLPGNPFGTQPLPAPELEFNRTELARLIQRKAELDRIVATCDACARRGGACSITTDDCNNDRIERAQNPLLQRDRKQTSRPTMPPLSQGADGNCTYQALTTVANYLKIKNGGAPPLLRPELFAARKCGTIIPRLAGEDGEQHDLDSAMGAYQSAPVACDVSPIVDGYMESSEFMNSLSDALTEYRRQRAAKLSMAEALCRANAVIDNGPLAGDNLATTYKALLAQLARDSEESAKWENIQPGLGDSIDDRSKAAGTRIAAAFNQQLANSIRFNCADAPSCTQVSARVVSILKSWDAQHRLPFTQRQVDAEFASRRELYCSASHTAQEIDNTTQEYTRCEVEQSAFQHYCAAHPSPVSKPDFSLSDGTAVPQPGGLSPESFQSRVKDLFAPAKPGTSADDDKKSKQLLHDALASMMGFCGLDAANQGVLLTNASPPQSAVDAWAGATQACAPKLAQLRTTASTMALEKANDALRADALPTLVSVSNMNDLLAEAASSKSTFSTRLLHGGQLDASEHEMVLVGQEAIGGQCGHWLRNSWGSCDSYPYPDGAGFRCDPNTGNIWIADRFLMGANGISQVRLVRQNANP
jgi:hypothetical protein